MMKNMGDERRSGKDRRQSNWDNAMTSLYADDAFLRELDLYLRDFQQLADSEFEHQMAKRLEDIVRKRKK